MQTKQARIVNLAYPLQCLVIDFYTIRLHQYLRSIVENNKGTPSSWYISEMVYPIGGSVLVLTGRSSSGAAFNTVSFTIVIDKLLQTIPASTLLRPQRWTMLKVLIIL